MDEIERYDANWQLYEIIVPGIHDARTVIAASLDRALAFGIKPNDGLQQGELLVVQNVTKSWIGLNPRTSASTWSLLRERREGFVYFDQRDGWTRVDP